jgi:hypothetical protein
MKSSLAALSSIVLTFSAAAVIAQTQEPPVITATESANTSSPQTAANAAAKPTAPSTTGAVVPMEGANSFTEAQAQKRITEAGFNEVTALSKDDKGIWRGTAMKNGAKVSVAVDFKGNVVQSN